MSKMRKLDLPMKAYEKLPRDAVVLGYGGDFTIPINSPRFSGWRWDCQQWDWAEGWVGLDRNYIYAAPESERVSQANIKRWKAELDDGLIKEKKVLLFGQEGKVNMKKTIYIAGKMRGVKWFNFPAFDSARDKLESDGWTVISPADIDRSNGFDPKNLPEDSDWDDVGSLVDFSIEECFDRDIEAVRHSDAIYMLKGWESSTGAKAEYWCARWLHKDIYFEEESICEEAYRIQGGDRQQDYGSPAKNFQDIADSWNWYMSTKEKNCIDARDVAHMMILMKIARNVHKPKRDNWVDMAGYSQCGGKVDNF